MDTALMDPVERLRAALADRYEIDREIGRGGMACVYRARDRQHDRLVAIKILRPELAVSVGGERFLREIRIAAGLQHPNILPLHDSGSADGVLYYVMPLVEGETLRDRIRREKQLPLADALRITREVADALGHAHAHGVVHRDIKPANILLSGGHAVVADFGIARALASAGDAELTDSGLMVGTPEYMSPEQGSGDHLVDGRSDIYALGCVLYEMLVGDPPFTGRSAQSVIARHRMDPPPSLRVVRPTLSSELEATVQRALSKVPADRFATAADFVGALEEEEVASSAPRRNAQALVAAGRRRRRTRLWVGALAAAGVAGIWWVRHAPIAEPDRNKVMVFPLVQHGSASAPRGEGEAVAIMIGSAFESSEPLKWIDGWSWLSEAQRNNPRSIDDQTARALTLRRLARWFVDGSLVVDGDSATVVLRLHDAVGDSLILRSSESGAADERSVLQLGLRALIRLLPALVQPGRASREVLPAELGARRPDAIANWLQGERDYRQARFKDALDHFERAVAADSALALAAVRGAAAAQWEERGDEAARLVNAALARRELLPTKYVALAEGMKSFMAGEADAAERSFRRALALDSTWGLGWMSLGEVYFHLLPRRPVGDSLARASFLNALREDPGFAPAVFHLAELAVWRRDLPAAESLATAFRRAHPDTDRGTKLSLMMTCARDGVLRTDWQGLARRSPLATLLAAKALSGVAAYPECAEAGFRAVLALPDTTTERWGAVLGLQSLLVARGDADQAARVLDSAAGGIPQAVGMFIVDAVAGAPMDQRAREVAASLAGDYGGMSFRRLWYLGVWAAHTRDSTAVAAIVRAMQRNVTKAPTDSLQLRLMEARLAMLRADTARAMALLGALTPQAPSNDLQWGEWEAMGAERMLQAEVLWGQGRAREAMDAASALDHPQPVTYLLYLPASLRLRMQAARALGMHAAASHIHDRLLALGRQDLAGAVP